MAIPRRRIFTWGAGLALATLAPGVAWTDHAGAVSQIGGGTDVWLLVGAVAIVVAAVAWAIFAPGADDQLEADGGDDEPDGHAKPERDEASDDGRVGRVR